MCERDVGGATHLPCQVRAAQASSCLFVLGGSLFPLCFEFLVDRFAFAVLEFGGSIVVSNCFGKARALTARGKALAAVFPARLWRSEAALLERE